MLNPKEYNQKKKRDLNKMLKDGFEEASYVSKVLYKARV